MTEVEFKQLHGEYRCCTEEPVKRSVLEILLLMRFVKRIVSLQCVDIAPELDTTSSTTSSQIETTTTSQKITSVVTIEESQDPPVHVVKEEKQTKKKPKQNNWSQELVNLSKNSKYMASINNLGTRVRTTSNTKNEKKENDSADYFPYSTTKEVIVL